MKHLSFEYDMRIDYSIAVSRCNYTIKCIPQNDMRQRVEDYTIRLFPQTKYCEGRDGLQNFQIYGVNEEDHDTFTFHISGEITTGLADYEEKAKPEQVMIFRHPHGLNVAGAKIRAYFEKLKQEIVLGADAYLCAIRLMHKLHQDFQYRPYCTDVHTSAEEAFGLGYGVCQDYAHIFISLLHLAGIPARYVTGLIIGEGASHAWVEILYNDRWYGLDPTHDTIILDEHIKIGIGRDAGDCMINRGIMHGGGLHTQTIKVQVKEI